MCLEVVNGKARGMRWRHGVGPEHQAAKRSYHPLPGCAAQVGREEETKTESSLFSRQNISPLQCFHVTF